MLKLGINLLIPPFLRRLYRSNIIAIKKYGGFYGRYSNWRNAQSKATGYDSVDILNQVARVTQQTIYDPNRIERDGVILENSDFSYPTLAYLCKWAMTQNQLTVMDIGGSLGSTYYQFGKFFPDLDQIRWMLVEQPHFVEKGKELFSSTAISFHYSIEEALNERKIDAVLLSASLQYFSSPSQWLDKIKKIQARYLIIDRIPISNRQEDQITIQYVPKHIYEASYPAWIFSKAKLLRNLLTHYSLIHEYPAIDGYTFLGLEQIDFRGFILERIQK